MDRESVIFRVVTGVLRSALREAGASGVVVLEAATPEGSLLRDWCRRARIATFDAGNLAFAPGAAERSEWERASARIAAIASNALTAHPANRTELLLGTVPPEPLLPLGDLPASDVARLGDGHWTGSPEVVTLATAAGGVDALDEVLYRWLERREPLGRAAAGQPIELAREIRCRFEATSFARQRAGLVPKLSHRTIGHDLLH
jgi:hypothetical protein